LFRKLGFLIILLVSAFVLYGCGGGSTLGNATLEGIVTDATNNHVVPNAHICLILNGAEAACTGTNVEGRYRFTHLPAGAQTIRVRANGYIIHEERINLLDNQTITANFILSPTLSESGWRIVLSWGENPYDLDSHLWVPTHSGYSHIYFSGKGNCGDSPWACLDIDDTTSYGPETITISRMQSGVYVYALQWYAGSGTWAGSNAVVRIYNSGGLVREFHVPNDTTHTAKSWWYIFDLNNGQITVHNTIQNDPPHLPSSSLSLGK